MSKKMRILLSITILTMAVLGVGLFISTQVQAAQGIPDNADTRNIKTVMAKAYDVIGTVSQTYDVSLFSSVFVDTPDYKLTDEQNKAIAGVLGQSATKNAEYLTAMQTQYISYGQDAKLLQAAVDKAKAENREMTAEEFQAVVQASHGQMPAPSSPITTKAILVYEFIKVTGDRAVVRYDDGAALQDAILVRIKGQWFIASITPISIHF